MNYSFAAGFATNLAGFQQPRAFVLAATDAGSGPHPESTDFYRVLIPF
jgi:hypothetical protein